MTDTAEIDYEAVALAETASPEKPDDLFISVIRQPETCESLWLPPCPICSWVVLWRRPSLDRLEWPGFNIARHTTARYGNNYYMLIGCPHASDLGIRFGPTRNRLKLAISWRGYASEILGGMYRRNYTPEQRAGLCERLGHPSMQHRHE